jgi:hypothetical protein
MRGLHDYDDARIAGYLDKADRWKERGDKHRSADEPMAAARCYIEQMQALGAAIGLLRGGELADAWRRVQDAGGDAWRLPDLPDEEEA